MSNPVGWFEIYVEDMARAKDFYEVVFQIKLEKLEDMDIEMFTFPMSPESYGAPGALVRMPDSSSGANSTLVYFSCEDCAEEADRARNAGGKVDQEKTSIGQYGFIAMVVDTEGNKIGLHSQQ